MDSGYQQAREGAAFDERRDRGRVRVSGPDAKSFLHALLTNDIEGLAAGTGCYAALLTPQGRMITDMDVIVEPATDGASAVLLVVPSDVAAPLAARLDKFVFSEDVAIADVSASTEQFSVTGPAAAEALDQSLSETGHDAVAMRLRAPRETARLSGGSEDGLVWRSDELGLDGFDIAIAAPHAARLREALARHAVQLSSEMRTVLRVEAGRPAFHVDMTQDTIPLEANLLDRAISTTKGCYVGQEVIIRVLHRGAGRVAKRLVQLRFEGRNDPPAAGDKLIDDERQVGRVTSAVLSPRARAPIGLGYVHRDFALADAVFAVSSGGTAVITSDPDGGGP